MRNFVRAIISISAAAAVAIALGGASLPAAAISTHKLSSASHVVRDFVTTTHAKSLAVRAALVEKSAIETSATARAMMTSFSIADAGMLNQLREAALAAYAQHVAEARAAADARAAAAAAAARAAAGRPHTAGVHPTPTSGYRVNVWTSGFQAQVNECRGGVDLTGAYHVRTVGEHWQCGGASFPESAGSIVTFTGLDAGTYKVIGVVATLNAYVAHTRNLPQGYQMLFQTCRNNDSHYTIFIALERLG